MQLIRNFLRLCTFSVINASLVSGLLLSEAQCSTTSEVASIIKTTEGIKDEFKVNISPAPFDNLPDETMGNRLYYTGKVYESGANLLNYVSIFNDVTSTTFDAENEIYQLENEVTMAHILLGQDLGNDLIGLIKFNSMSDSGRGLISCDTAHYSPECIKLFKAKTDTEISDALVNFSTKYNLAPSYTSIDGLTTYLEKCYNSQLELYQLFANHLHQWCSPKTPWRVKGWFTKKSDRTLETQDSSTHTEIMMLYEILRKCGVTKRWRAKINSVDKIQSLRNNIREGVQSIVWTKDEQEKVKKAKENVMNAIKAVYKLRASDSNGGEGIDKRIKRLPFSITKKEDILNLKKEIDNLFETTKQNLSKDGGKLSKIQDNYSEFEKNWPKIEKMALKKLELLDNQQKIIVELQNAVDLNKLLTEKAEDIKKLLPKTIFSYRGMCDTCDFTLAGFYKKLYELGEKQETMFVGKKNVFPHEGNAIPGLASCELKTYKPASLQGRSGAKYYVNHLLALTKSLVHIDNLLNTTQITNNLKNILLSNKNAIITKCNEIINTMRDIRTTQKAKQQYLKIIGDIEKYSETSRSLTAQCLTCTEQQKQLLGGIIEQISRLLNPNKPPTVYHKGLLERLLDGLCRTMM